MLRAPLISSLRSLGRGSRFSGAPPRPDEAIAVIGDLHGAIAPLPAMLSRLSAEVETIVTVGDYVDRGLGSAKVLALLRAWQAGPGNLICLAGNHEYMLCRFLDEPVKSGPRWLRNGGLETLRSFGVAQPDPEVVEDLLAARDALRLAMGERLEHWLRGLPRLWQSGNVAVAHAGANPTRRLEEQDEKDLLWGHADFLRRPRSDGMWMVHGHWIHDEPSIDDGRIAVDVGAWQTGRLAAVVITPETLEFVEVDGKRKGLPRYGRP